MYDIVKIASADYATKGASSLPDVPEIAAATLKRKFDEISLDVIIPKTNEVIDRCNDLKTIAEQTGQVTQEQIQSWTAAAALAATALQPADISTLNSITEILTHNNAGAHNAFYRGKSLGTAVTEDQWTVIGNGTFTDIYPGDYWTIDDRVYLVGGCDYWYGTGDTNCTTHHLIIIPAINLIAPDGTNKLLNSTDTATGAYVGTNFYKGTGNNTAKADCTSIIDSAFGSAHILTHREYLKNAITNNYESAGAWYDSTLELPSEEMVYGHKVFGNALNGTNLAHSYTNSINQLPVFAHNPALISNRSCYWLRDVVGSASFTRVSEDGQCSRAIASNTDGGIRPVFGICAEVSA